jgi:hypothetical protein
MLFKIRTVSLVVLLVSQFTRAATLPTSDEAATACTDEHRQIIGSCPISTTSANLETRVFNGRRASFPHVDLGVFLSLGWSFPHFSNPEFPTSHPRISSHGIITATPTKQTDY